ncbi:MAG: hypothetical protein LBR74_07100, partial [Eubacterium sp.]|nr:hypothetical protein [Eubacterium sp.]
ISREKTKRLEAEKKIKEKQEQEAKRKQDTRRCSFIGKLVIAHFPELLIYTPKRSETDNRVEFALVNVILSLLADDKEYLAALIEAGKNQLHEKT